MKRNIAVAIVIIAAIALRFFPVNTISSKEEMVKVLPKDTMSVNPEIAEYIRQTEGFTLTDYIRHPQFLPVIQQNPERGPHAP